MFVSVMSFISYCWYFGFGRQVFQFTLKCNWFQQGNQGVFKGFCCLCSINTLKLCWFYRYK